MIIYKHTNIITNLSYIGFTKYTMEQRLNGHIKMSQKEKCTTFFHKAIREYGIENFKSEIIEYCVSYEDMCEKEKYWIEYYDTYNNGYNMNPGGGGFGKQESIDKFRNSISKLEDNGKTVKQNSYIKRNKTLLDNNQNALKEIGLKSSKTQKENAKNLGTQNPRFGNKKILLINMDGEIMNTFYPFEIKKLDNSYPKRMLFWCLKTHKPMYTFNNPRKNIDKKFCYSIACYEDELYCNLNINRRECFNIIKSKDKQTYVYEIYNNEDILIDIIENKQLKEYCLNNNMKLNQFQYSYRNNIKISNGTHKGWYCVKVSKPVDTEKLDKIDKCIEKICHTWRFEQALVTVFGSDYEKTLDRKRISEYIKWVNSDTLKEESSIISDYGFEPKDIMSKVSQKAKEYFFAVENSNL